MSDPGEGGQDDAIRDLGERWVKAIASADIKELGRLMVDDVVVVHGDGRCLSGRVAVLTDLASAFSTVRVTQRVEPQETIVAGEWAIDRARVHTTVTILEGGEQRQSDSHTLTVLRKVGANDWRVARVIGVVERADR